MEEEGLSFGFESPYNCLDLEDLEMAEFHTYHSLIYCSSKVDTWNKDRACRDIHNKDIHKNMGFRAAYPLSTYYFVNWFDCVIDDLRVLDESSGWLSYERKDLQFDCLVLGCHSSGSMDYV